MNKQISPPIITDDNGDMEVYATVEAVCLNLEAVDVRDGVYEVFDSTGRPLRLTASGETISVELEREAEPNQPELEMRLRRFIERAGPGRLGLPDYRTATLDHLLRALS